MWTVIKGSQGLARKGKRRQPNVLSDPCCVALWTVSVSAAVSLGEGPISAAVLSSASQPWP